MRRARLRIARFTPRHAYVVLLTTRRVREVSRLDHELRALYFWVARSPELPFEAVADTPEEAADELMTLVRLAATPPVPWEPVALPEAA